MLLSGEREGGAGVCFLWGGCGLGGKTPEKKEQRIDLHDVKRKNYDK